MLSPSIVYRAFIKPLFVSIDAYIMPIPRTVLKDSAQGFPIGQWRVGPRMGYVFAFQSFGKSVKPVLHVLLSVLLMYAILRAILTLFLQT